MAVAEEAEVEAVVGEVVAGCQRVEGEGEVSLRSRLAVYSFPEPVQFVLSEL